MYINSKKYLLENVLKIKNYNITLETIQNSYIEMEIPKKNGTRKIYAIKNISEIYLLQKNLLERFFLKVPLPICVKGFCKEESYNTFLQAHIGKKYYMRLDIQNFFDSITMEKIEEELKSLVTDKEAIEIIIDICTLNGILPQGAVTSPAISNIIFRRIDQRILKYCQAFDVDYTRYADDMMFSSDHIDFYKNKSFYRKIAYILRQNGFKLNFSKRHIEQNQIALSGFVVKEEVSLSRKKMKNINTILYYFKNKDFPNKYKIDKSVFKRDWLQEINELNLTNKKGDKKVFKNKEALINYLAGYRAFLIGIVRTSQPIENAKINNLNTKIKKIENILEAIEKNEK